MDEDTKWLIWAEKQFNTIAGDNQEIDIQKFTTALNVKQVGLLPLFIKTYLLAHFNIKNQILVTDVDLSPGRRGRRRGEDHLL